MSVCQWFCRFWILSGLLILAAPVAADDPFGGPPTPTSGDGTTTWGAIYINDCTAVITFAPSATLWFKVDAWRNHKIQIWLDDEPRDNAANFFEGTTQDQAPNRVNGFWLKVYSPDALAPNYAYADQHHRADLLTTVNGIRPDGSEIAFVGMANHNPFIPEHLLWYEAVFDGWVYLRVENKVPWHANAVLCALRVRIAEDPPPPAWDPDPFDDYTPPADQRD